MLKMIEGIYSRTTNDVITGDGISENFETGNGVRQGCPLSPTLFNIALDDMDEEWERKKMGGTVIRTKIYALKYADDIAMVAESAEELGEMLKSLEKYVEKAKIEVNVKKTKIMIFRKRGRLKKGEGWKFQEKEIEVVNEFKYLGYWFTQKITGKRHIRQLVGKEKKATNTVWGVLKRAKVDKLRKRLTLMDSLVKAGALYGVKLWGWKRREEIERMQGRFVIMAMGLARNTPDYL